MTTKIDLSAWFKGAPTPVCIPVAAAMDEKIPLAQRHDALWFSVYQLLRCTGLVMLSETLQHLDPAKLNQKVFRAVTRVLTQIRHPYFADWITLFWTLLGHRKALGLSFVREEEALELEGMMDWKVSPAGYEDKIGTQPVLEAFRLLRNLIAHGGMRTEAVCKKDIEVFLPYLRELIKGPFAFLSHWEMLALQGTYDDDINRIWRLQGTEPKEEKLDLAEPENKDLAETFSETPVLVRSKKTGLILNIYPWFLYREEPDLPKGMLDGFFLRGSKQMLFYLDRDRREIFDPTLPSASALYWRSAHERLGELLGRWRLTWEYDQKTMTPWKLRDPIEYNTSLLVEGLLGTKYIPGIYCERKGVDDALAEFCFKSAIAPGYPWRAVLLGGELGRGKSALLTHLAKNWPERPDWRMPGEEDPLVLFVRCDGAGLKADILGEDMLFRNVAPLLGIKADGSGGKGYSGFPEFLSHLDREFSRLERPCRFVLLVDALNEAPYPEALLVDLVRCIQHGRNFPWLRIVFSVRTSYLLTLRSKRAGHGGHESNPLYEISDLLVPCPFKEKPTEEWELPPLSVEEARRVFENYKDTPNQPSCLDSFESLKVHWEREEGLLRNPLYIHFWMEAFDRRRSASVSGMEELFECWLQQKFKRNDGLWDNMRPILQWLMERGRASFDEGDGLEFRAMMERGRSLEERRTLLSPLEVALSEGLMVRPVRGEGAIQFPFEALAAVCFSRYMEERLQEGIDLAVLPAQLTKPGSETDSSIFLGVSLYLEKLFKRGDFNLMARFLEREPIREHATLPWILREMGKTNEEVLFRPELQDAWKKGFMHLMNECSPEVKAWVAEKIDRHWTEAIRERFTASPRQVVLIHYTVDWRRKAMDPAIPQTLRDLCISLNNCGNVLGALGGEKNLREALEFYLMSLWIAEELKNPAIPETLRDLSISLDNCGNLLRALGGEKNLKEALKFYQESLRIREELKNPAIPKTLADHIAILWHLSLVSEKEEAHELRFRVYQEMVEYQNLCGQLPPDLGQIWEQVKNLAS